VIAHKPARTANPRDSRVMHSSRENSCRPCQLAATMRTANLSAIIMGQWAVNGKEETGEKSQKRVSVSAHHHLRKERRPNGVVANDTLEHRTV